MHNAAPPHDAWSWEAMIEEFCALGGVAKNVTPGEGWLFAGDPAEPVLVRVPPDLLLRIHDVAVVAGRIVVDESADVSEPARRFFERYANTFSLRAERTAEIFSFVDALAALPADVREVLETEFGCGPLLKGDREKGIRNAVLRARQVLWSGGGAIAPVIELARYGQAGLRPERGTNLQIQGYVKKEILVRFAPQDAFSAFRLYGRAVSETAAFSLPTTVTFEDFQIDIGRKLNEGAKRGKDRVPDISRDGQKISLAYLLLGQGKSPSLPRSVFRTLLTEVGLDKTDEAFDMIVRFNALKFIRLLQCLEPHEGETVSTLRRMARYQLKAMSHCVGSRRIESA
jgi:hypothetical protein